MRVKPSKQMRSGPLIESDQVETPAECYDEFKCFFAVYLIYSNGGIMRQWLLHLAGSHAKWACLENVWLCYVTNKRAVIKMDGFL